MEWDDIEEICAVLSEEQPRVDPRAMSEAQIVALVTELSAFTGDPHGFDAGQIEAIRAGVWWGA